MFDTTTHKTTRRQRATTAVILLVAIATHPVVFTRVVNAQTSKTQETSPAKSSEGARKEGIQVHGHWTIEVRNPDGRLVSRRDFENALTTVGAFYLASVMGRQFSVGEWVVEVGSGSIDGSPCSSTSNPTTPCSMYEATGHFGGADNTSKFKTLSVSMLEQGTSYGVILSGNAIAQKTGTIARVGTNLFLCAPTVASSACFYPDDGIAVGSGNITGTTIAPVNLTPGQIIQVKVVISFS